MAKLSLLPLAAGLFAVAHAGNATAPCDVPSAPAAGEFATRLTKFGQRSGATDFVAKWDPVDNASGMNRGYY